MKLTRIILYRDEVGMIDDARCLLRQREREREEKRNLQLSERVGALSIVVSEDVENGMRPSRTIVDCRYDLPDGTNRIDEITAHDGIESCRGTGRLLF